MGMDIYVATHVFTEEEYNKLKKNELYIYEKDYNDIILMNAEEAEEKRRSIYFKELEDLLNPTSIETINDTRTREKNNRKVIANLLLDFDLSWNEIMNRIKDEFLYYDDFDIPMTLEEYKSKKENAIFKEKTIVTPSGDAMVILTEAELNY